MKSLFKFGIMKTETIAKGIMICTTVIVVYRVIPLLNFLIPQGTEITSSISTIFVK